MRSEGVSRGILVVVVAMVAAAGAAVPGDRGGERAAEVAAVTERSAVIELVGGFEWMHELGHGPLDVVAIEPVLPLGEPVFAPPLAPPASQGHPGQVSAASVGMTIPVRTTLTEGEMRRVLDLAGWSGQRLEEALAVSFCESSLGTRFWHLDRRGDGGRAYGAFQIHWFPEMNPDGSVWEAWGKAAVRGGYITAAEYLTPEEPVANAKVARYIVETRDHWGGTGGWATCAENAGVE